jgi:copper chaperone CopZ
MCSKAVKNALERVSFVKKVDVNIKDQEYSISFKDETKIDFDVLAHAVEDAGFSVSKFMITANLAETSLTKDAHIKIDSSNFHFLNTENRNLSGMQTFRIVDKQYLSAKEFRKYSGFTNQACMQTGHAAKCCLHEGFRENERIYHVVI